MDMQGTPLGSTNQGTKNTTTPAPAKVENPGPIASDSLAAESARQGGAFSSNPNSNPQAVSGSSSTFANTDTSAATTLAPAADAATRLDQDVQDGTADVIQEGAAASKYPEGSSKRDNKWYQEGSAQREKEADKGADEYRTKDKSSGDEVAGPSTGTVAANNQQTSTSPSSDAAAPSSVTGPAPTYSNPALHSSTASKPKGTNITEGIPEVESAPNASFNTEIGTENDPGRVAEENFQRQNLAAPGDTGPKQTLEQGGTGQYDVLRDEQAS